MAVEGELWMAMGSHQQFTSELIRERLAMGGDSATWLAQAVISYYRPKATAPSLTGFTNLLDAEAQSVFFQLLAIRTAPDWSDDDLALLCRDCEQYLSR